jgi:YVTN family beta-propeller protein
VKVEKGPIAIGVSPDGGRLYVLNNVSHSVSVVDPRADQVVATIPVGANPRDLVVQPDGRRVYVSIPGFPFVNATNPRGRAIAVIDTAKDQLVQNLTVDNTPLALAVSPEGQRLYVTHGDRASGGVEVIHTVGLARENTRLPGGYALAVAVSPDAKRLYVLSTEFSLVAAVDVTTSQVVGAAPPARQPIALASSPDGRQLYLMDLGSKSLLVIDAATMQVSSTINLAPVPAGRR